MIKKNTKAGGIPLNKQNAADFSQGSIGSRIMAQAIPLSLAEIVQLLYNIVDRIFLGHLPDGNTLALTGVGLIFPVVSIVAAFTSLYSSGGAPIFAMARGRKDEERALQIQGTVFALQGEHRALNLQRAFLVLPPSGHRENRRAARAVQAGERRHDGHDRENQPHAGQRQRVSIRQVPQKDAIHDVVEQLHDFGQAQRNRLRHDAGTDAPLRKIRRVLLVQGNSSSFCVLFNH